jgi:hypothetical protein
MGNKCSNSYEKNMKFIFRLRILELQSRPATSVTGNLVPGDAKVWLAKA